MREWAIRSATVAASVTLAIVAAEVALRITTPVDHYVWPPGLDRMLYPDSTVMPGIFGPSRFTINSSGIRGEEFDESQEYRILAIGGSTTECMYLDDAETWPMLLQTQMRNHSNDSSVWVGNVGLSGRNTRHHIHHVEQLLAEYPPIDAVILLVGINDLGSRLASDTAYRPFRRGSDADRRAFNAAFSTHRATNASPFYKRTELWKRISAARERLTATPAELEQDSLGQNYVRWREHRASASEMRDTLPDLASALQEFSNNLRMIIHASTASSVRVILVTQPSMYRDDLSPELMRLLWMGGVGAYRREAGSAYYSVAALERGLAAYNSAMLEVCDDTEAECIDLASQLERDTTTMYDDVHFNENGARRVAQILADHLQAHALQSSPAISAQGR